MTSFIRGAISATRRVAPLHQCWSHMSQTTMAVSLGCHLRTLWVILYCFFLSSGATVWLRAFSVSGWALPEIEAARKTRESAKGMAFIGVGDFTR